jgi:hypothetical protein
MANSLGKWEVLAMPAGVIAHSIAQQSMLVAAQLKCDNELAQLQSIQQQCQLNGLLGRQQQPLQQLAQADLAPVKANAWYHRERAERCVKDGDDLIVRMAGWREVPIIGYAICNRLAAKLEVLTDRLEREAALA